MAHVRGRAEGALQVGGEVYVDPGPLWTTPLCMGVLVFSVCRGLGTSFRMGTTDRTPLELEAFLRTQQPIFTPVGWRLVTCLSLFTSRHAAEEEKADGRENQSSKQFPFPLCCSRDTQLDRLRIDR